MLEKHKLLTATEVDKKKGLISDLNHNYSTIDKFNKFSEKLPPSRFRRGYD